MFIVLNNGAMKLTFLHLNLNFVYFALFFLDEKIHQVLSIKATLIEDIMH